MTSPRTLTLITGTGRSGTSTMSGSLHHLGLTVPGPFLGANESNPRGFFESRWSVRFHNELVERAGTTIADGRPEAFDLVQGALTPKDKARVVRYLTRHDAVAQLVVKDPRTTWTQALWRDAAAQVGREIRYISMLRHPAEVVGSRTTYYGDGAETSRFQTKQLQGWVNGSLVSERETRGQVRSLVLYSDLVDDWRPVLERVGSELGLTYDPPVVERPHPVDEFIDRDLRRHQQTWDDLDVPGGLRSVAQQVWADLVELSGAAGSDPVASAGCDVAWTDFRHLAEDGSERRGGLWRRLRQGSSR